MDKSHHRTAVPQLCIIAIIAGQISYKICLRVIDVGQAQSLLLTCGEDAILVDAGEYAAGGRVLAALSRAGVKSLTAAILTHPHGDHYGGMRTMLEKTQAAAFYTSAVPENQLPTTQSYEKLLSTLSEQAIPAAYLFAGDTEPLRVKPDENSGVRWFAPREALAACTEPWMRDRIYQKLIEKNTQYK